MDPTHMTEIRSVVEAVFREFLPQKGEPAADLADELILLESGIDSLGFAIIVTRLEQELGYDPFILMAEAVYPTTFGEFVAIYQRHAPAS